MDPVMLGDSRKSPLGKTTFEEMYIRAFVFEKLTFEISSFEILTRTHSGGTCDPSLPCPSSYSFAGCYCAFHSRVDASTEGPSLDPRLREARDGQEKESD